MKKPYQQRGYAQAAFHWALVRKYRRAWQNACTVKVRPLTAESLRAMKDLLPSPWQGFAVNDMDPDEAMFGVQA